ncbi:FLC1 [Candida theae]|uniref:FLC1 n=1 Tax=Candida theae TaxID=1198502 RepID=A0AAD5BB85_9ASCO|nr:FLC1 [Candida theae]KAI5950086.1 FLC1 [Candida theae]
MLHKQFSSLFTTITLLLCVFITPTHARRKLSASSLVTCMEKSQITPHTFNVTFNPDDRSLRYNLDLNTEISGNILAHVQVYAYGFLIIERDVNLCDIGWKQFCPIYPGQIKVDSIQYISSTYTKQIPGIAYQVPDIDAVVKVIVRDQSSGESLSCLQASFTNGKTVSQTGVKWATAVIAGLGLLIGAMLSTFGNSNAASHIAANAVALFLYFQSVVVVSMQAVERVPPIASAWAENLAWSMGLIEIKFMQKIFRWYVQSTGGKPTTYFIGETEQILVQKNKRSLAYDALYLSGKKAVDYAKRSLDYSLHSNTYLIVLRGIRRIGHNTRIESTSIVPTGYTWFVLIGYLLVALLVFSRSIVVLLTRFGKLNPRRFSMFRANFGNVVKGSILRYIWIGATQLTIFSLWEFTRVDSAAVVVLAVLFLLLMIVVFGWSFYNVLRIGKLSQRKFNNPAALLYGEQKTLEKYGFLYTMFNAKYYWFGLVLLGYNVFKGIFIAFCQESVGGKVSVWPIFIADLVYTIVLFWLSPFLNKPTNIMHYMIAIVTTINSFLFLFFSDIFGQPAQVASIMGWVFFILNAAFSFVLLIFIIVLSLFSVMSKNPDARFAPAKDDRFSFQRKSSIKNKGQSGYNVSEKSGGGAELAALGIAAQEHDADWESQMYKLHDVGKEEGEEVSSSTDTPDHIRPNHNRFNNSNSDDIIESESVYSNDRAAEADGAAAAAAAAGGGGAGATSTFGEWKNKLARKLSKKKSDKKHHSGSSEEANMTRISDTLHYDDDYEDEEDKLDFTRSTHQQQQQQEFQRPVSNHFDTVGGAFNGHARNGSSTSNMARSNPTHKANIL